MGVGTPEDLLEAVARGIDMFDCVMPTRDGRHGRAFTRFGPINLRNARHAEDPRPLDEESPCAAARDYSRAYLHHLIRANEMLGAMLLSEINLAYYQELMAGMRVGPDDGTALRRAVSHALGSGAVRMPLIWRRRRRVFSRMRRSPFRSSSHQDRACRCHHRRRLDRRPVGTTTHPNREGGEACIAVERARPGPCPLCSSRAGRRCRGSAHWSISDLDDVFR